MWGTLAIAAGTTAMNYLGNKAAGDASYRNQRKLQEHDFAFQREMWDKQLEADNTAIQRRMADADAAGLNANLLFNNGGSGASTPSVSGGSSGSASMQPAQFDLMTAMQVSMQKERQDAEIDALVQQTSADVELKNAQSVLALKQAGLTDKEINFFIKHGVPAGSTTTTTRNTAFGPWSSSTSDTIPIGINQGNSINQFGKKYEGLPPPPRGMSRWEYNRWLKRNGYKIP